MVAGVAPVRPMQRCTGMSRETWVIILAGGEGTRLAPLTRALYGADLPKQYAVLRGTRSLLQETAERAALIGDLTRTVVVVSAQRAALAAAQLEAYPGVHVLAQPRNLDTGPGLLLPLAYVRARDPQARVVVLPADHHLPDPAPLVRALARAGAHRDTRRRVTLIGVEADRPETEYGWILPGARLCGHERHALRAVRRFVEKPPVALARRLRARGALWNTFIATGPVGAFWELARAHLPRHAEAFARWAERSTDAGSDERLQALYAELPAASWSHDVVTHVPGDRLAVVAMTGSGWADWGAPRRVFQSLAGTAELDHLLARVQEVERAALARMRGA